MYENIYLHVQDRARRRYGFYLSFTDWCDLSWIIYTRDEKRGFLSMTQAFNLGALREKKTSMVHDTGATRKMVIVKYKIGKKLTPKMIRCIYDTRLEKVITLLPLL